MNKISNMDTIIEIEGKKWRQKETHISKVSQGDVILHDGQLKTLSDEWIKRDTFLGDTIWGGLLKILNLKLF